MIKKIYKGICIALTIALAVPLATNLLKPFDVEALTGSGMSTNPYIITTAADLDNVRNDTSAYYKLGADIDLAGYSNWNPIPSFTGNFDGAGYTIKNLKINRQTTSNQGLFAEIYNNNVAGTGVVKNVKFSNAYVQGGQYTGVVAGKMRSINNTNKALIDNVEIQGEVNTTYHSYIGGVTGGINSYGDISNAILDVKVTADNSSLNNGTVQIIGGVAGYVNYGTISNVINKQDVITSTGANNFARYVGGIVGQGSYLDISSTINLGKIDLRGNSDKIGIGGLIGYVSYGSVLDSINYGNIDSPGGSNKYNIGGVVGEFSGTQSVTKMQHVANLGDIKINATGSIYQVGGIIGYNSPSAGEVKYSLSNHGDITLTSGMSAIYNIGGLIGYEYASGNGTSNTKYSINTGNINVSSSSTGSHYNIGGLLGYANGYTLYIDITDNYTNGTITVNTSQTGNAVYNVGGLVGQTSGYNYSDQVKIYRNYFAGSIWSKGTYTSGNNYNPSGIVGNGSGAYMYYNVNAATSITNAQNAAYYFVDSYNVSGQSNNRYVNTLTGGLNKYSTPSITPTQAKTLSTYTGLGWSTTYWSNKTDGTTYPYLKDEYVVVESLTSPTMNQSFQGVTIPLSWVNPNTTDGGSYNIFVEKMTPSDTNWVTVGTYTSTTTSYDFNIPAGTPGNTKFRWTVRGKNAKNDVSLFYPNNFEFLFANNTPTITATFVSSESALSTSLNKRVMNFSLNTVNDPDSSNYLKLFVELNGVAGTKKQIIPFSTAPSGNLPGPVNISTKINFKLKLIPNFASDANNYDLVVVDANDESKILATIFDDRPMLPASSPTIEAYSLRMYVEDFNSTLNTQLSTSNITAQSISIDTRNNLPTASNLVNDVNGRTMSANQGFNRIKISGTFTEIDPEDNVKIYYAVKQKNDNLAGKYALNPSSDTLIKSIVSTGTGITDDFETTYTLPASLENGNWVIVVYATDQRGGISEQTVIDFAVDKTTPEINFFADYNGNMLATAPRKIAAKDSELKMFFSARNYTTFEYAGYLVKANQQNASGSYTDLKIRGAFTNDVPAKFIGVNLNDSIFENGDMLVFKFRAISSTGVTTEKDVRVLIGDATSVISNISDSKIPIPLLIQ